MMKTIKTPLTEETIASLKAGDEVRITGTILTARDQAHLRLFNLLEQGKELPVDLNGQVVYYCGPSPPRERAIGSCGPTTSGRMDPFTPRLLEAGVKGMIGKGKRSGEVRAAIKRTKAVYFVAPAGAGAFLSEKVRSSKTVAFKELGAEAIYKLEVEDFPAIVAIDCKGNDIYASM
ncbi:MAG: FumA C-terminus/TtdB family hydratase beta subunit [Candidatus Omnitrophota bacterium]